jgi:hypothetical protein
MNNKHMFGSLNQGKDSFIFNIHQIRTLSKRDLKDRDNEAFCIVIRFGEGVEEVCAYRTAAERDLNFDRFRDLLVEF